MRSKRRRGIIAPWRLVHSSGTATTLSRRTQQRRPPRSQAPAPMSSQLSSSAWASLGEIMSPSSCSRLRPMTTSARS